MLVRPSNPNTELWDGPITGCDGVINYFGADEVKVTIS